MAKSSSSPTRVMADVAATAASVAATEHRTATEQINYWARIGMQVERAASVSNRRLLAVIAGDDQFSALTPEESSVAHATIDARMAERAAKRQFGRDARRAGRATVSIDDDGNLIRIDPDGSRHVL